MQISIVYIPTLLWLPLRLFYRTVKRGIFPKDQGLLKMGFISVNFIVVGVFFPFLFELNEIVYTVCYIKWDQRLCM